MKIYIANDSRQQLGGGFTFIRNFIKGCPKEIKFVEDIDKCDVFFVPSVSMVLPETFYKAVDLGKRIVLRVDNVPKKSRNLRSRIYSRMTNYMKEADVIIYQSLWSQKYAGLLNSESKKNREIVIYNGVDKQIFHNKGRIKKDFDIYMFSQFNRDDTKQMHKAFYYFHRKSVNIGNNVKLYIVGQFSPELIRADFDFFMGEQFEYYGVVEDTGAMAKLLRHSDHFLYSYFNDACSNSLLEAISCGCKIVWLEESGGAFEIKNKFKKPEDVKSIEDMCREYLKHF